MSSSPQSPPGPGASAAAGVGSLSASSVERTASFAVVTLEPLGLRIECRPDETVFQAAKRQQAPIPTACVGRGTCGLCRVKVLAGEEALSPINSTEKKHLGNTYFITKQRLTCQLQVRGDVTLLVPDAVNKKVGLKK